MYEKSSFKCNKSNQYQNNRPLNVINICGFMQCFIWLEIANSFVKSHS